jgi:hypothetical protein
VSGLEEDSAGGLRFLAGSNGNSDHLNDPVGDHDALVEDGRNGAGRSHDGAGRRKEEGRLHLQKSWN